MTQTTKFGNDALVPDTAGNETLANRWLAVLEYLLGGDVLDDTLTAPPGGTPAEGDLYIVAASPTGAWTGQAGKLALWLNGWRFIAPKGGLVVHNRAKKAPYMYSGLDAAWFPTKPIWSTSEHWTGEYRGSKKVYAKCFTAAVPASGLGTIAHGISSIDLANFVHVEASVQDATNVFAAPAPQFGTPNGADYGVTVDATNINVQANGLDYSATATIFIRLTYTK